MEIDDKLDDFLVEQKRHTEIIKALKSLESMMSKDKIDPKVVDELKSSIDNMTKEISGLVKSKMQVEVKQAAPIEVATFDQKSFDRSLNKFSQDMQDSLDELKAMIAMINYPKEFEHTIERSSLTGKPSKVISKEIRK